MHGDSVLIGGTLPSAPNISLNADGLVKAKDYATGTGVALTYWGEVIARNDSANAASFSSYQNGTSASNVKARIYSDGNAYFGGYIFQGNPLHNPNIALNADDGSATFAGDVNTDGTFIAGDKTFAGPYGYVSTTSIGVNANASTALAYMSGLDGSINATGDVRVGGTIPSAPNISLNASGSAEFAAAVQIGADPRNGNNPGTRLGTTTGVTAMATQELNISFLDITLVVLQKQSVFRQMDPQLLLAT